jgi:hypothetical protein
MTSDEFRDLVGQQTDVQLLGLCLNDDVTPYVFEPVPATWKTFRDDLALKLGVAGGDIRIVGSGRLGFSLKPWRNLTNYKDTSDIDVVVVNAVAFDELWLSLLHAVYPRPPFTQHAGSWLRKWRNEIYTGWITPPKIRIDVSIFGARAKPVLELRTRWFNALQQASRHPPRRHEEIEGRLYRTWRHAELYHLNSLAQLRKSLA